MGTVVEGGAIVRQGYRIGRFAFACGFEEASELAPLGAVARLPNAPAWLRGLANLHGQPVPVFDLAPLLETEHDADEPPMLLVVGRGEAVAALLIDGLPRRMRLHAIERSVPRAMPALLTEYVHASYEHDGEAWLELDAPRLLDALAEDIGAPS